MSDVHPEDYAFPVAPGDVAYWQPGMSLRDWFAAQALPAVITACAADTPMVGMSKEGMFAQRAFAIADAMMSQRSDQ